MASGTPMMPVSKSHLTVIGLALVLFVSRIPALAQVKPGDTISKANADKVIGLVSPGNLFLVKQGMQLNIVPTATLAWPPPYRDATEKYSSQVRLNRDGGIENYVAGLPFPLLDPNDPQIAQKVMWNFSFRPGFSDDFDIRDVEIVSYPPGRSASSDPVERILIGHFAYYSNIGRTEVPPTPTDPDFAASGGIRYRFAAYPFLEPTDL